jgi:hypothetical protein
LVKENEINKKQNMPLSVADRFKAVLIQTSNLLFNEIIRLSQEGEIQIDLDEIELIITTIETLKSELIIEKHLEKCSLEIWKEIVNRNEQFFHNNLRSLFSLEDEQIKQISHLFSGKKNEELLIPSSIRDQIWNNIGALVRLSILFLHEKRKPSLYNGQKAYSNPTYLQHLDIWTSIHEWKKDIISGKIDAKWDIADKLVFN